MMENNSKGITLGIDASRNRSGGAKAHLIGIINHGEPEVHGIERIHVWTHRSLSEQLPERAWLVKHTPSELEGSLAQQMLWQRLRFPKEARKTNCDIVLNCDAGTIARVHPSVTMSRDMLCYEPGAAERYGLSKARVRLFLLRYLQNRSLRIAEGAVYITEYAKRAIQKASGANGLSTVIHHGIGEDFRALTAESSSWPEDGTRTIRGIYVSNAAMYKHQWEVARAIAYLREKGHRISLTFVGGGTGSAQRLLEKQMRESDPDQIFLQQLSFLPHHELPKLLANSDFAVFASSCEALGITLLEKMAAALPIACSKLSAMPELLEDGGVYFDPEDYLSIADSVEQILSNAELRLRISHRAKELSEQYSWQRSANDLFAFLHKVSDSELSNARKREGLINA